MPVPFRTPLLIVCAAAGLACASDESLAPIPKANESRVFTHVSLSVSNRFMVSGKTFPLSVVARDQLGVPMRPDAITYLSGDPAVATVSDSGIVTAVTVGTTTIWATVTIGASSRTGMISVTVYEPHDPYTPDGVLLLFREWGWEPPVIHVDAGALVEWSATGRSWSGMPTHELSLWDENHGFAETLDLSSGLAKWRFETPGTYWYCAGGCWDPPDFGVIHVK